MKTLAAALPVPLRLALRELRGGLGGLRLLAVCIVLGTAALAAVGSLSAAILDSIRAQGQALLGGDLEVRFQFREANPAELAAIRAAGEVSHMSRMRAMVRAGEAQALAELKAVDALWPLYGRAVLADGGDARASLRRGALLAPELADSLRVRPGDAVQIGRATFPVAGIIAEEPDRAGAGFALGPSVLIDRARLAETDLVQLGSLIQQQYRIRLPAGASAADVGRARAALLAAVPDSDWQIRDRSNGAPGLRNFIGQMGQFLTLVGLTALVVAGVGVGQGVAGYMAGKTGTIATLKGLGASSQRIGASYLAQIGLVTLGAVLVGLALGAAAPWAALTLARDALPVAPAPALYWRPLLAAALFGALVALSFALWPLARAALSPPARLLRSGVEGAPRPARGIALLAAGLILLVALVAVLRAEQPLFAAAFLAGVALLIGLLAALALGVRALARRAPHARDPLVRLGIANLHRPGTSTPQLVVALGLGLALFATLAMLETSLKAQIERSLPADAPDIVVFDVPKEGIQALRAALAAHAPGHVLNAAASLRGPVTAVNGVPVRELRDIPEEAWVLRGDRGLSYSATPPPGNEVVEGQWWPADYAGPPLVSMDAEQARLLGLGVGDSITVAVLGAEIEARIANLRRLDFTRPTLQYMFVYNPAALAGAPHSWVATVALPEGADERGLRRALARDLPTASVVGVRETVERVNSILGQVLFAVRAAAAVAIAAGLAVLVGAIAASARRRIRDSALLKVLGATRGQVLRAQAIEYALLAVAVAAVALMVATAAALAITQTALRLPFAPDWAVVLATVGLGAALILGLGMLGSWRALAASPAQLLRGD